MKFPFVVILAQVLGVGGSVIAHGAVGSGLMSQSPRYLLGESSGIRTSGGPRLNGGRVRSSFLCRTLGRAFYVGDLARTFA